MTIKFTSDEMRYITFFEGLTGARIHDCVINEDSNMITFVVKKGDIGLAIGKGGSKIKKAKQMMGKSIEVVEYSDNPIEFLKNTLSPARVKTINIIEQEGRRIAMVTVEMQDKGVAVGRKGRKIQNAKKLAQRHYDIHDISLT
ncbi:MAG: NusA-like transcription termination signal-binding factor [Candidatus Hodarchaeaceae archaeon]|nr:NusA-like transcription termination signal-binding factor [Candidatus Hodarchaeaceae archaeon]